MGGRLELQLRSAPYCFTMVVLPDRRHYSADGWGARRLRHRAGAAGDRARTARDRERPWNPWYWRGLASPGVTVLDQGFRASDQGRYGGGEPDQPEPEVLDVARARPGRSLVTDRLGPREDRASRDWVGDRGSRRPAADSGGTSYPPKRTVHEGAPRHRGVSPSLAFSGAGRQARQATAPRATTPGRRRGIRPESRRGRGRGARTGRG